MDHVLNQLENPFFPQAKEDTDCCTRMCCGPIRPFDMVIRDNFDKEVIHLYRPLRCQSALCPCCLQVRIVLLGSRRSYVILFAIKLELFLIGLGNFLSARKCHWDSRTRLVNKKFIASNQIVFQAVLFFYLGLCARLNFPSRMLTESLH